MLRSDPTSSYNYELTILCKYALTLSTYDPGLL